MIVITKVTLHTVVIVVVTFFDEKNLTIKRNNFDSNLHKYNYSGGIFFY